ncbi:MAG: chromosome partitioning protein ParA [Nostoc sp.]
MAKNWLILSVLSFGVGFGISLAVDRDVKRAALTGLITVPATSVGVLVTEKRRNGQLNDTPFSIQTRVAELEKRTEILNQEEASLQTSIATKKRDKQQLEVTLGNLQIEMSQLQTLSVEQQCQNIAIEEELVEIEAQRQQLTAECNRLQTWTHELRQQELILTQSLEANATQKQQLETDSNPLQSRLNQLQVQVSNQQSYNQEQVDLTAQKHLLETELQSLQSQIHNLQKLATNLNQSLEMITAQKEEAEVHFNQHTQELSKLQNQIAAQADYSSKLTQDLADLEQQKHHLEIDLFQLKNRINDLEQQLTYLSQSVTSITSQQEEAQVSLNYLHTKLSQLQQQISEQQEQKEQLIQELTALAAQKEEIAAELSQIQLAQIQAKQKHEPLLSNPNTELPPTRIASTTGATTLRKPYPQTRGSSNFMKSQYTKNLWEEQILPHWSHRDRPAGHRFLGSIYIKQKASEELLDIVGQNLQQLDRFTYDSLQDRFYELEQNWLKILTVALSEYAYYYSSDRFWQGFCKRLNINHNQGVEHTFRRVVDEGINLLGLVRAKGGYKYISTLWLQSGVPEQNLVHFAQLVQEIADEYGWWELAHTSDEELSQLLLSICQEKHLQWGTLINFLKSSYSEDPETEPISGQLLQGIAIVAQELERKKASPQALEDEKQREEILGNYYLPHNFFLRNWNALTQVLTPRSGSSQSRGIITRRSKPLLLSLDIGDSLNTQLMLPEQVLWKPEWRNLRGTYCRIPQAKWEDTIPTAGDLIIPELIIEINQASENWNCQMLDHNRQNLLEWHYKGISSDLPCLVFDASTGEHLPLNLSQPTIIAVDEVFCFTPKDIQPEFANGIEVLDSYIPSSIQGWRGRLIRLTTPESSIVLTIPETNHSQLIIWKLVRSDEPVFTGLRLTGKNTIYLEPPTFWYPPINQTLDINVLVENITERYIVARTIESLSSSNRWVAIKLTQWITEPGCYEARFWFDQKRWSYRFEVKSKSQFSGITPLNKPQISSDSGFSEADLPIKHDTSHKFWAEVIKLEGLWPLEEVILCLSNGHEKIPYQLQAEASGSLRIHLSTLYDLLPNSDSYALDYQRLGLEPQRLVQMQTLPQDVNWTWTSQAIHLSGLLLGKLYSLSCWNFLLPDLDPVVIKIPLIEQGTTTTEVILNLPPGIYHIQLVSSSSQGLTENLGWWCGSGQYDLPEDIEGDEAKENYCYTILGNRESKESFIAAVNQLKLDFDRQQMEARIFTLENNQYYFPAWLNRDSLLGKVKGLLEILSLPVASAKSPINVLNTKPIEPSLPLVGGGNWYLVNVRSKKRDFFLKCLDIAIKQNNLQKLILKIKIPQDLVYQDMVLLNLSNFRTAYDNLQKIECFQSMERRPLQLEQVSRMLGNQ